MNQIAKSLIAVAVSVKDIDPDDLPMLSENS
jgi:hypothetical protein